MTVDEGSRWVRVGLNRPLNQLFTYRWPCALGEPVPGSVVRVPLGRRQEVGVLVETVPSPDWDPVKIRPVTACLREHPPLPASLVALALWIAEYYHCAPGEALAACLPPAGRRGRSTRREHRVRLRGPSNPDDEAELEKRAPAQFRVLRTLREAGGSMLRSDLNRHPHVSAGTLRSLEEKGLVAIEPVDEDELLRREIEEAAQEVSAPKEPTAEQSAVSEELTRALEAGGYAPFLLHGVTGSGKTEVYLAAIERALALGRSAIFLVPEIALTPQTTARVRQRFPEVAVLHSGLTDRARSEDWRRIREGQVRVVVGARSAVLAPLPNLGLIVVDEEHEPSFKQQATPRYHGRDVAVYRAYQEGAVVVLGSATPSLESWHNVQAERYRLLRLEHRVANRPLPTVHVVDLAREAKERREPVVLSSVLRQAIRDALARREQVLLLQNRRGYAPVLYCGACGLAVKCRHCDVSLTVHRRRNRAICHQCYDELPATTTCPTCREGGLVHLGSGTEKVEESLGLEFPSARVRRMDSDTMLTRAAYDEIYQAMVRREIDILIGTQMIAKGLDFPGVTVVGVIQADLTLCIPDFRSPERTFQLISQVAGRSGRGDTPGVVFVQSYQPEHPAVTTAARHDYEHFAARELKERRQFRYPPFGRLLRLVFESSDAARCEAVGREVGRRLVNGFEGSPALRVQGPAPAVISYLRGRFRFQVQVFADPARELSRARRVLAALQAKDLRGVKLEIDVDPVGS